MNPTAPLADVRVLDVSRVLAGPFCGQLLGDLGADVIKIERPGVGDETRSWGPPFLGELSAYFLSCNRNKRSVTLDISKDAGREILYELARKSDVILENFRASSASKLGLTPEQLLKVNPQLIICSISGYGRSGPMSDVPGYDVAIQARSGLMSITGPVDGPPCKVGVAVTDVLTGLYAAVAILSCLHARKTSGHGYTIELALLDCAVAAQVNVAQAFLTSGKVPARQGNAHLQIVPYQPFETSDGWIILAIGNDRQFETFCKLVNREELPKDERFQTNPARVEHRETLIPMLESIFQSRSTQEWLTQLSEAGVPHAPVQNYQELFDDPQAQARGIKVTVSDPDGKPVDLIGSPFQIDGAELPDPMCPPQLSAQTQDVLKEVLGVSDAQLSELFEQSII